MKWKYFTIPEDDQRAKDQVIENISMGAAAHSLTKRLLSRFSDAAGPIFLIAFESLDLDYPYLYKYATYNGGQSCAVGAEASLWTDSPRWGLVDFVDRWLHASSDAVVLCENWLATRERALKSTAAGLWESRLLYFQDEVYHMLTSNDAGQAAAIESALRESQPHWGTGVCSRYADMPGAEIATEGFFDLLVANTTHIFTPALDGEGYLVWSPTRSGPGSSG